MSIVFLEENSNEGMMNSENSRVSAQKKAIAGTCPICGMTIMGLPPDLQSHFQNCAEGRIAQYIDDIVQSASAEIRAYLEVQKNQ